VARDQRAEVLPVAGALESAAQETCSRTKEAGKETYCCTVKDEGRETAGEEGVGLGVAVDHRQTTRRAQQPGKLH